MQEHEAVRENKRKNDREYYRAKDKERVKLVEEEVEYRRKRDEAAEEFLDQQHKLDLENQEKIRAYYEN